MMIIRIRRADDAQHPDAGEREDAEKQGPVEMPEHFAIDNRHQLSRSTVGSSSECAGVLVESVESVASVESSSEVSVSAFVLSGVALTRSGVVAGLGGLSSK